MSTRSSKKTDRSGYGPEKQRKGRPAQSKEEAVEKPNFKLYLSQDNLPVSLASKIHLNGESTELSYVNFMKNFTTLLNKDISFRNKYLTLRPTSSDYHTRVTKQSAESEETDSVEVLPAGNVGFDDKTMMALFPLIVGLTGEVRTVVFFQKFHSIDEWRTEYVKFALAYFKAFDNEFDFTIVPQHPDSGTKIFVSSNDEVSTDNVAVSTKFTLPSLKRLKHYGPYITLLFRLKDSLYLHIDLSCGSLNNRKPASTDEEFLELYGDARYSTIILDKKRETYFQVSVMSKDGLISFAPYLKYATDVTVEKLLSEIKVTKSVFTELDEKPTGEWGPPGAMTVHYDLTSEEAEKHLLSARSAYNERRANPSRSIVYFEDGKEVGSKYYEPTQ